MKVEPTMKRNLIIGAVLGFSSVAVMGWGLSHFTHASTQAVAHGPVDPLTLLPHVVQSMPISGATGFGLGQPVEVHFSERADLASLNSETLNLLGPQGRVEAQIEPLDNGKGARIVPNAELFPNAFYSIYESGVRSSGGAQFRPAAISFHTVALNSDSHPSASGVQASTLAAPREFTNGAPFALNTKRGSSHGVDDFTSKMRVQSVLADGVWHPGQNNLDSRWRLNLDAPKLVSFASSGKLLPANSTALFGQILQIDDKPVAGVEVSIGKHTAKTDAKGLFLLSGLSAGRQELFVDGAAVGTGKYQYGQFLVGVDIADNKVTSLQYQLFLPKIDPQDRISIPSPTTAEVVIRHPDIPGLEIRIPKDTVIRDHKGRIISEIAVVPTPVDRAPYPVPVNFPVYFTLQPGGAQIIGSTPDAAKGVRVVYPNYAHADTGVSHDFLFYEPQQGWKTYGAGAVSADNQHVVPGMGVALFAQMSAGYLVNGVAPASPAPPPGCICDAAGDPGEGGAATAGDPVDLSTGLFVHRWDDIAIQDVLPINIARTYRPGDTVIRPFGYGMTHNYAMYLYNPGGTYAQIQLVMPDGSLIKFDRIAGSGVTGTWKNTTSNTRFYGATVGSGSGYPGSFYYMRLRDGTQYDFTHNTSQLQTVRDRYGNELRMTYTSGRLTEVRSPSGRYVSLAYDASNRITQIKDHTGRTYGYAYNAAGTLDTVTYPDSTAEHYAYDTSKRMLTIQDRRGNTMVTNQYDTNGRVTKQTMADGAIYQFAYNLSGSTVTSATSTDPRGIVRNVVFDATRYPSSDTVGYGTSLAQTYTFERQANSGYITARVDPLGRRTEFTYDTNGNVLSKTNLASTSNAVTYAYTYASSDSKLTSVTDPLGHITRFTYTDGCLTQAKDALNRITNFTCNSAGQPTSVTDPLSRTTQFTYDGFDLYSITDPLSRTTTFYRDGLGRVVSTVDAMGNRTRRSYDVSDRVISATDAINAVTQFSYDGNGNLTSLMDTQGGSISYVYDAMNRSTQRTDALTKVQLWSYDGLGNVLTYTDRKGQLASFTYDALGRLDTQTRVDSTTSYQYDAVSRVTQIIDSLSGTIAETYDGLDRLTQELSPQGTVTYGYDSASRRTSLQVPGHTATTYAYDVVNRIASLTRGSEVVSYGYDNVDRRTSLTLPNGITAAYGYDLADQITSIAYANGSTAIGDLQYSHDPAGRITSITGSLASDALPSATTSDYQYNANNQLTTGNGYAPVYDYNGDMIDDGQGKTYTWDARRRLIRIDQGIVTIASFEYDALGRRTSKIVGSDPAVTYLHDGNSPIEEKRGTAISSLMAGVGIDERYARDDAAGRLYFLTDHLGSTIALTDSSAALQQQYAYTSYGSVTATGASGLNNPYQYTGRENDGTGLYYYRARYYSPTLARFISEDPIQEAAGMNAYAYVDGDPISFTDPYGESAAVAVAATAAGGGECLLLGAAGLAMASPMIGTWIYNTWEPEISTGVDAIADYARNPYVGNKPGRKKQGREAGEKKRQSGWKSRNPPKEPPRHSPSRKD